MAAFKVDDAQAAHPQRHAVAEVHAFIVRSSMDDGGAHAPDVFFRHWRAVPAHDAGNPAHRYIPSSCGFRLKADAASRSRGAIGTRMAAGSEIPGA